MSDNQLMSLDDAMRELQIDQEGLKKLFRENNLRYILDNGRIRIPKMALMGLKIEKMTTATQKFEKIERKKRKKSVIDTNSDVISAFEALEMLQIGEEKFQELINSGVLRYFEEDEEFKFFNLNVRSVKLQMSRYFEQPKLKKKRPRVKRIY